MASERNPQKRRRSSVHQYVENISHKLDQLSKGISKGITAGVSKTKKFAIEKVVKAEPTKETDEMMEALAMFNTIQNTFESLLDGTITNVYESQADESRHSLRLSEAMMSLETFDVQRDEYVYDLFKHFGEEIMGRKLFKLNTITNEYLVKMEKELINPISIYKSKELHKANQLMTEYESIKTDYDFAVHRYNKLMQKKDDKMSGKIAQAEGKKEEKLIALQKKRVSVMECVHNLQQKQQVNLVNCFDKFWKSYSIFAEQQAQTITLKDERDHQYETQKQLLSTGTPTPDASLDSKDDDHLDDALPQWNNLQRSTSLRVAVKNNDNQPLSKELRYKNPIKLGSGAFATVYKANDLLDDEREVAIKKISIGDGDNVLYLSSTRAEAENELKIMKLLTGHTCIIRLVDDYYEESVYGDVYLNLVMDYVPFTLLSRCEFYGASGDAIPLDLIQIYAFQLIKAVNYMHIHKVAHRDVKPDNLLINVQSNALKLCDFGCSIQMKQTYHDGDDDDDACEEEEELQSYVCSRYYRAPELILQSAHYDCKVDVWSIGCVIAEMFLGTLLFEGYNDENEQLDDIINKLGTPSEDDMEQMNAGYVDKEEILSRDEMGESWSMLFIAVADMPENAVQLISKIIKYAPKERWSTLQCLNAKYFEELKTIAKYKELFNWTEIEIEYAKQNGIELFNV
eukprot:229521_1